jgi:mycothiol synthase
VTGTDTVLVREATSTADLDALVAVVNDVTPDDPTSLGEIRWSDVTYPGGRRFVAASGGRIVGAATVGRIYVHPPDYPDAWASIAVVHAARRRGIGERLLMTISDAAGEMAKTGLQLRTSEARPEGIAFLEHRGFTELERAKMVRLTLIGRRPPEVRPPAGITLTTLADRPELVPGVHAVALEAFPDIPGGDTPITAGDLAEFRARDIDRPNTPPDGFVVAVDAATGDVVGYANLTFVPGSQTVAWHDMTAVRRDWRGRGLANSLKAATIVWAMGAGLEALDTGNDVDNAPMRAVNRRLGYEPLPDEVFMRGPLFRGAGERGPG